MEKPRYKIAYILEATGGGTARHVMELTSQMLAEGHEVHLLYSPLRMDTWFEEGIKSLPYLYKMALPMKRSPGPWDIAAWCAIRKYLRRNDDIHLIHGHSSKGGALAVLVALGTNQKAIYTPHDFRSNGPGLNPVSLWVYRAMEHIIGRLTAKVIAVSPEEEHYAKTVLKIPAQKVAMIPNGVPPLAGITKEEARKELGLKKTDVVIGFVGRMVYSKGLDVLIPVLGRLVEKYKTLRPVIVGNGEEFLTMQSLAKAHGLEEKILWQRQGRGQEIMPAFDIFALPSRNEGMPYVLLEALQAGLPIVATQVGGANLTIEEGRNGFIVPVENAEMLEEALDKLLGSESLRHEMGAASLEKSSQFTLKAMTQATIEVYGQCLNR